MLEAVDRVGTGIQMLVSQDALTVREAHLLMIVAEGAAAGREIGVSESGDKSSGESTRPFEELIHNGTFAQNELLKSSPALVTSMARRVDARGIPSDNIIREGVKALLRTVERYATLDHMEIDGRTVKDQIIREVGWAIRQAVAQSIASTSHPHSITVAEWDEAFASRE